MAEDRFSLKDHLFNATTMAQLGSEFAAGVPGFDSARFEAEALSGFAERELLARLDWIADCIETQMPRDFPAMAEALETAMPARLDPTLKDDDFGHFIHAVPGILAVRHGLEAHRDRALDVIYQATQRFSMEFYIRPFLNHYPEETLARLALWAQDENYHVRRLVSEGTRPRLPWAKAVTLTPDQTLPLLDRLHNDATRYVTRSVANHLNDLTKSVPDLVMDHLDRWAKRQEQSAKQLDWMTRHALRTRVKDGNPRALKMLGFDPDAPLQARVHLAPDPVAIGQALEVTVEITCDTDLPVLVDYVLTFPTASGKTRAKTFKLKQAKVKAGVPLRLSKAHKLKGDATTFTLVPGLHKVAAQINGAIRAEAEVMITA